MRRTDWPLAWACVRPPQHILHDWDDADSVKILKSIKEAAGAGGELVLMEAVIAPPGTEHPHGPAQKTLDTLMMCIGGKERSHGEWTELLADGGWKLDKVRREDGGSVGASDRAVLVVQ
jgi:hypothetical protein